MCVGLADAVGRAPAPAVADGEEVLAPNGDHPSEATGDVEGYRARNNSVGKVDLKS